MGFFRSEYYMHAILNLMFVVLSIILFGYIKQLQGQFSIQYIFIFCYF